MTTTTLHDTTPRATRHWRVALWIGAGLLIAAPFVAMRLTSEMQWTASDFLFFGVMVMAAAGGVDLLLRRARSFAYRLGATILAGGLFLLVWVNLAVGIIGSEDNPANLAYAAIIATGIGGALASHRAPRGLARTALVMAALQVLIAAIAVTFDLGTDGPIWPRDVIGASVIFTGLWLVAAAFFHVAATQDVTARR